MDSGGLFLIYSKDVKLVVVDLLWLTTLDFVGYLVEYL